MDLRDLVTAAVERNASDIHVAPGRVPSFRIDGQIRHLSAEFPTLSATETEELLFSALDLQQRQELVREKEIDSAFQVEIPGGRNIRLRGNLHGQLGGWGGVFRVVPDIIPTPEEIDLEPALRNLVTLPRGLVLITGPTGSGKTTTLACLAELINQRYPRHILTIEDPIEYIYHPQKSKITQRELKAHTHGFAPALRSALRADPDVILLGEMRDQETIQLALTASETGHLIFSTLHTTDAAQTVDRIIDVVPPAQQSMVRGQLASVLQAVVSQVLLPHASGKGRVAAREILLATPAIRTLIREQHTNQIYNALGSGANLGLTTLESALAAKVRAGQIQLDNALAVANRPATLLSHLQARSTDQ